MIQPQDLPYQGAQINQKIFMAGPGGSHDLMERVYEDILPQNDLAFHHCTIAGRVFIRDHVRHTLIRLHDGEDISVNNGKNSLLQYMKFVELNPTGYNMLSRNPYFSLPNNLLVYRSCYPIRVDERSGTIGCAKESSSLNIRIYALSIAEFMSKKLRQRIYMEYDVWRELAWYHYVLESIIKPKISPHFVGMMSHFMCMGRQIDFDRLNHNRRPTQSTQLTLEVSDSILATTLYAQTVSAKLNQPIYPSVTVDLVGEVMGKHYDEIDPALQCYSGNSLIIATEAPHENLYQWASRKYQVTGKIGRMLQDGFHSNEMWRNVLFQVMHSLYTMQVHGLYLYQMSIEDNVQIREIENSGKFSGYWQYVINGISYYLPNEGYLVMVDSSFKDIPPQDPVVSCGKRVYKIQTGGAIGPSGPSGINGVEGTMAEAREGVFQNYRKIISTNAFGKEKSVTNNLVTPSEHVMQMIQGMMKDSERDLSKVIATHFRMFLNNRIGTYLDSATEVPNIRTASDPFRRGEMAILVIDADTFKWCLVLSGGKSTIQVMTKENPKDSDMITKNIPIRNLRKYSQSATLTQSSNDYDFSEEKLLETYVINSR